MKSSIIAVSALLFAVTSAQTATSIISIKPACPTGPAPNVVVTRSAVVVPSCAAASNATRPVVVSMSMASGMASSTMRGGAAGGAGATGGAGGAGGAGGGMSGNATRSGSPPVFTGAATKEMGGSFAALVGLGAIAGMLL